MTYRELYESATRKLEKSEITLGEYEEMTKPLNEDVRAWIPVSERLPEEDGRYLCTYEDDIEENCVDFGSYKNGEWYVDKVIAWMPLPEPYKAERSCEE